MASSTPVTHVCGGAPTPVASGMRYMTSDQLRAEVEQNAKAGAGHRNVEIYDYSSRRLDSVLPMKTLNALLRDVRCTYLALRLAHPDDTDAALRERMMSAEARFRGVGDPDTGTHTVIFCKVTNRDTPDEHMKVLSEMMQMRARHERDTTTGTLEKNTAEISAYFSTRIRRVHEDSPTPAATEAPTDDD